MVFRSNRSTVADAQTLVDRKNREIGALQRQLAASQRELAAARAEIERMRQEIVNSVSTGTETSLTQVGLRKLYNGALRNPDGTDKPIGATVSETVARLTANDRCCMA